jgi:hypothetical protein
VALAWVAGDYRNGSTLTFGSDRSSHTWERGDNIIIMCGCRKLAIMACRKVKTCIMRQSIGWTGSTVARARVSVILTVMGPYVLSLCGKLGSDLVIATFRLLWSPSYPSPKSRSGSRHTKTHSQLLSSASSGLRRKG